MPNGRIPKGLKLDKVKNQRLKSTVRRPKADKITEEKIKKF
jgi:hypothetical protein